MPAERQKVTAVEHRLVACEPEGISQAEGVSTPSQPAIIARSGVVSRLLRIAVGLSVGSMGFALLLGLLTDERQVSQEEMLGIGGLSLVFLWPGLCLVARNLHAFQIRPVVALSPAGIHVRKWADVGLLRSLLPYHRIETWDIPWNAYEGTQVFSQSTNGVVHSKELFIFTDRGKLGIPWGIFDLSVERLQNAILDYREIEFRLPQRIAAGLSEFQRRRFAEPVVFRSWTMPFWIPAGLAATAVGITVYSLGLEDRSFAGDLVISTWGIGVFVLWHTSALWWRQRNQAFIELRADGLVVSGSAGSGRPVPWEDLLFARACTKSSHWGYGARDENAPGVLEAIEVRMAGGRSVRICAPSATVLERLHGLLEPPLDRLLVAKQRIAAGEAIEAAAKAAGLMTRA